MKRNDVIRLFEAAGIDSPVYDADTLIERFGKVGKAEILAYPERDYSGAELLCAINRRASHEPLQYIVGICGFFAEEYKVSPCCLIPRADTEILVEYAISNLPQNAVFADLCTGSGCIAISTLSHRKDCTAHAFDVFDSTLDIAKQNAESNHVSDRVSFYKSNLLTEDLPAKYDMIISNPPYIRTSDILFLSEEVKKEPAAALDGGESGMLFYERFLNSFTKHLLPNGCFVFEIGFDQKDEITELAKSHGMSCDVKKDLCGNDRMAIIKPNP